MEDICAGRCFVNQKKGGRRQFTEDQTEDICARGCIVCKKKGCQAQSNDKKKGKEYAIVNGIQFSGAVDHALEKSTEESEN